MTHHSSATPEGQNFIPAAIGFVSFVGPDTDRRIVSISELAEGWVDDCGEQFGLSPGQLQLLASRPDLYSAGGIMMYGTFFGYAGASVMTDGTVIRGTAQVE